MKKGIEILKEVYFCNDKKTAETYNMEYSATLSYIQILIDYAKYYFEAVKLRYPEYTQ